MTWTTAAVPVPVSKHSVTEGKAAEISIEPARKLFHPAPEVKELSGTTWRCTRASKKCRGAASAWFLAGAEPSDDQAIHDPAVSPPGMRIVESGLEKLFRGEAGISYNARVATGWQSSE